MSIRKSTLEKYKYITKENNWKDTLSSYIQNPLVGILSVNDFLKDHERIESLENYGVPVGLVYKKPDRVSYSHEGGSLYKKRMHGIPRVMEEDEASKWFSSLITIYKNGNRTGKNNTRKNKKN